MAASPGDLTLFVDWSIDFTPGERRLLMIGNKESDNESLAYTDVDDVASTIEARGVVLPWDVGDPVTPVDPTGMPEETWTMDVDLGDLGAPVPCHPSHALQDKLREDDVYVGVRGGWLMSGRAPDDPGDYPCGSLSPRRPRSSGATFRWSESSSRRAS